MLNLNTKHETMSNANSTWSFLQMFIYASIAFTGIMLVIYGIYHFTVTFIPGLVETASAVGS